MIEVLTAEGFQTRAREKLLEYEIYQDEGEHLASTILRGRDNLSKLEWLESKDTGQKMLAASTVAEMAVDFVTLAYSAGANLAELRAFYPLVMETWLAHEKYHVAYGKSLLGATSTAATYALLGDAFHYVNRMVCFGILLGWGEQLSHVARIIKHKNPRMDGMLERLLSYYVPGRDTSITTCTRHLPYFKTLKVFNASTEARPGLMAEYLEVWYEASRRESYYDSHTRDTSFKGYWSWEAAAITFLLDIDDTSYRNAEFYPAELVDFARRAKLDRVYG